MALGKVNSLVCFCLACEQDGRWVGPPVFLIWECSILNWRIKKPESMTSGVGLLWLCLKTGFKNEAWVWGIKWLHGFMSHLVGVTFLQIIRQMFCDLERWGRTGFSVSYPLLLLFVFRYSSPLTSPWLPSFLSLSLLSPVHNHSLSLPFYGSHSSTWFASLLPSLTLAHSAVPLNYLFLSLFPPKSLLKLSLVEHGGAHL